jgi:hypothetical protein
MCAGYDGTGPPNLAGRHLRRLLSQPVPDPAHPSRTRALAPSHYHGETQPMVDKLKQAVPLAVAFGVLAFAWIEISLNFSFHWFDNGDLGNGLGLPANFHLVAPAAFITWALFFAAGADMAAATKVAIATVIGATAGLVLMVASPATADLPDFWGIAVWVGILGFGAVILSVFDWYYAPASLAAFTAVGFWWLVTGMDGWAEKVAESVAGSSPSLSRRPRALAPSAGSSQPLTPGSGSAAWPRCSSAWFSGSCPPFWRASLGAGTTSRAKTAPPHQQV